MKGFVLKSILLLVVLSSVLGTALACRAPQPTPTLAPTPVFTPTPTATPVPAPTGELRIAMAYLHNEILDPSIGPGSARIYLAFMYDWLVGVTPDGKLSKETGLAKDWEVKHTATNSVYTFTLREGVKFHNGDPVTADDVKFSIEYFVRPESVSSGAPAVRNVVDKVEVLGPYKVAVSTKKPYIWLVHDLSAVRFTEGMVLPKNYIEKNGAKNFATNPIGSGPYRFVAQQVGSYIDMEAMDRHWRVGIPKYKKLRFMQIPEEGSRIAMLRRGETDLIDISRERLGEVAGFPVFTKEGDTVIAIFLGGSWKQGAFINDKRVREALNIAIDRESILKYIYAGKGTVAPGEYSYSSWALGFKPLSPMPYDPERARALLKEAFPQGVKITYYSLPRSGAPELMRMNEAVADMWRKVGVTLTIVPTDYATYRPKINAHDIIDEAVGIAGANGVFRGALFDILWHSKGLQYWAQMPELDAIIDEMRAAMDQDKFAQLMYKASLLIRDQWLIAPIAEVSSSYATNPEKIKEWDLGGAVEYDINLESLITRK